MIREEENFEVALLSDDISDEEIIFLLGASDTKAVNALSNRAYEVTTKQVGHDVYFRGLIEISNICTFNCRYCGIRKSNLGLSRYEMSKKEIIELSVWAANHGLGNVCLQSGERQDKKFVDFIAECLKEIHQKTVSEKLPHGLGITLSLGDQEKEVYEMWAEASGNRNNLRYLARFETSNEKLFKFLHSSRGKGKTFEKRLQSLRDLRDCGYQVGTGVMIGIPGQTLADLCADIRMFQSLGVDMIGMGPYLKSAGGDLTSIGQMDSKKLLQLSLNMIAVTRIVLKDVNIAAATALDVLDKDGRKQAISYGANVLMPNPNHVKYKQGYQLYDNKPSVEKDAEEVIEKMAGDVLACKRTPAWSAYGSSLHWKKKAQ